MKLIALLFTLALALISSGAVAAESSPGIAELQAGLAELGYGPGPVDGYLGPQTRAAIKAFQKDQGLEADGKYSEDLPLLVEAEKDDRANDQRRKVLLAMSDDQLLSLIQDASQEDVGRLLDLIPEKLADLPIRSTFGKSLPPGAADVVFSMPLRFLFYPPTREGVEQFQSDTGAKLTGELTMRQFFEVHRRWLRKNDTPVYSGGFELYIDDDLGSASASGTWLAQHNEILTPINSAEITCDRKRQECLRATVELYVPSLDGDRSLLYLSADGNSYLLQLAPIRRYHIIFVVEWRNHRNRE
jgi:peptidoglycan hydrolase-like protein with peptidoglycan-binding domain